MMYLPQLERLIIELQTLSPMPDDEELVAPSNGHQNLLERYIQVTENITQEVLIKYPLEVITPLLESMGIGEGFGAYWSVLHCIESFPQEHEVYTLIQQASHSYNPGTRKWCCLLMGRRRDANDIPFLLERLQDITPIVRCYALMSIEMMAQKHVILSAIPLVSKLLEDDDKEV